MPIHNKSTYSGFDCALLASRETALVLFT